MQVVNIANNLFSGSIDDRFFQLPHLSALSAVSNCFTGSLNDGICEATTLTSLDFDGVGSNKDCCRNLYLNLDRPSFIDGTFEYDSFYGSIPSCLLNLPVLQALHLSANNLHGAIPKINSSVSGGSPLVDLVLCNNELTGTIPISIQSHSFNQLDLSNNRLRGTLVSEFNISPNQTKLSLSVNRLSGPLPNKLKGLSDETNPDLDLNILASQIFQCSVN